MFLAQVVLLGAGVVLMAVGLNYLLTPTRERAISKALDFEQKEGR